MLQSRSRFAALAAALALAVASAAQAQPHNVIIFVADGLRSRIVTPQTAPALAEVRDKGVDFANSHSLFPTVTTPNASAIATGHRLGDTGDFGNTLFVETPFPAPFASAIAGLDDDDILGLMNERYAGNYLNETSLLQAAQARGFSTAALGKLGPADIQDVTARKGVGTIVIDDLTGWPKDAGGLPLDPAIAQAIKDAGLAKATPDRGLNTWGGAYNMPGVHVANVEQQDWFAAVATKVLLPRFKAAGKPFVLVFWSRDPDGTQHSQGDSLNKLEPGINGPTSMAAIRNASNDLAALRKALDELGLADTTDVVITADHGFSTMSRESPTSASSKHRYPDVVPGFIPPGFLAIDLSKALGLPMSDAMGLPVDPAQGFYPKGGALLGADTKQPQVVVAPNGGTDLIYLPGRDPAAMARRVVAFLTTQDYVSAIFVRDDLGPIPGALPTSLVGLSGSALTPTPAIFVSFKSFGSGCADPELCGVEIADTSQQHGQGIHGSFGRQDTHNFMAAIGPDFKAGYVDPSPVSNADWAVTLAHVLGLDLQPKGKAVGRVMDEALAADGAPRASTARSIRSEVAANGFFTQLDLQQVGDTPYFDAAGMPGRVIGLKTAP
jgi:arylsulfatase A-like enzyme